MSSEIMQEIGALRTGLLMTNRRIDDLRREIMVHIMLQHRKRQRGGSRIPWLQIVAMGTVALSSILGLVSPEKAAAILRALMH